MRINFISLSIALILLASCSHNKGTTGYYKVGKPYKIGDKTYIPKEQKDYDETGMASWYGSDFHKKETANGGTFDRNALTAAHRTLPLPSMVRVTNLSNNKTLIVMVNDRGPFSKDRIIDMSERAADILGFKNNGVTKVRVQYLPGQTKRLLADLPGTKGKIFAENNSLFAEDPASDDSNAATPLVPKISKASNESAVVKAASIPEKAISQSNSISPATKSIKLSKNTTKLKKPKVGKKDTAMPLADTDTPAFSDADSENPTISGNTAPIEKPAKNSEEKVEEISQEVHFVQAGTYGIIGNAKRVEKSLASLGTVNIVPVKINGKLLYKVKIGPILDRKVAELALKKTITLGHPDALIVKEGGNL